MAKTEVKKELIYTCRGTLSFPYLVKADEGRQYSDGKFKGDLIIPGDVWKAEGKKIVDAILAVAEAHFGKKLKISEFKNPLKLLGADETVPERFKNCVLLKAKSKFKPTVYGANKVNDKFPELNEADVAKIKGGDIVRFIVNFYPYEQSGGGVAAGLQGIQFIKVGDAIGQGKTKEISLLEDQGETEDTVAPTDDGFGFATT